MIPELPIAESTYYFVAAPKFAVGFAFKIKFPVSVPPESANLVPIYVSTYVLSVN